MDSRAHYVGLIREKLQGMEMQRALMANKEQLRASAVTQADFLAALAKISKSVGSQDLEKYNLWVKEFGSA